MPDKIMGLAGNSTSQPQSPQLQKKQSPVLPKQSAERLDLLTFIKNPDLPLYDPKKYKMPKELIEKKRIAPFKMHPRTEMDKTFEEIFSFNKMRTDEEMKSVEAFFQKHPRRLVHSQISIAQIMECLFEEKQRLYDEERIRNIAIEAKKNYKQRIANLNEVIKKFKVKVPKTEEIRPADKVQWFANDDLGVFYKYKRDTAKVFDKAVETEDIINDNAIKDLSSLEDINQFLHSANSLIMSSATDNTLQKLQKFLGAKTVMKTLNVLRQKAKKSGKDMTSEILEEKISLLKKKFKKRKHL